MKTIRLTLSFLAVAMGALVASAQQAPVEAVVASFVGAVTVTAPGSSVAVPAVVGQKLPEGSTVTTAAGATALIESHEGISTGLGSGATAVIGAHSVNADGVRTAVIDLKEGTTVSVLDPSKRKINNYGVRTPKGVAAARGTTYSCTVKLSSGGQAIVTVNTLTGAVNFSIVGGKSIDVAEGKSANSNSSVATSIAAAIAAASPEEKAQIAEALKATVAVVATISEARKDTGDTNAKETLKTVLKNTEAVADEVSKSDKAFGESIKTDSKEAQKVDDKPVVINEAKASNDTQKSVPAPVSITTSTLNITVPNQADLDAEKERKRLIEEERLRLLAEEEERKRLLNEQIVSPSS